MADTLLVAALDKQDNFRFSPGIALLLLRRTENAVF